MIKLKETQDVLKKFEWLGVKNREEEEKVEDLEEKKCFALFLNEKTLF